MEAPERVYFSRPVGPQGHRLAFRCFNSLLVSKISLL
jgi:hypothetical protein